MMRPPTTLPTVQPLHCAQIALYVMCGGGRVGLQAAEQPGALILPSGGRRLPYPRRLIYQAAAWLTAFAHQHGLDPCALPPMPQLAVPLDGLAWYETRLYLVPSPWAQEDPEDDLQPAHEVTS